MDRSRRTARLASLPRHRSPIRPPLREVLLHQEPDVVIALNGEFESYLQDLHDNV